MHSDNNLYQKLKPNRLIHLLYVPTLFCNMGCRYCYLGDQTVLHMVENEGTVISTLEYAIKKFLRAGVLPFNISLHGGEVTTLSKDELDKLFKIIGDYYIAHFDELQANNFRKSSPHIKTNLYNFREVYDVMDKNKVSISASIDVPLSLHEKYRTAKNGHSSLNRILKNLSLLARYPHSAKISSTLFGDHLKDPESLIKDIWFIHREIGFDMNQFNFMFGFNSALNNKKLQKLGITGIQQVDEEKQVQFYRILKDEFIGTELEYGFKRNWFDEFTPTYCTCAPNCGERFYLLQADGNIYSCVRGQGVDAFHYGNIYNDDIDTILALSKNKIRLVHQEYGLHDDCKACDYLALCHTGCPFVKKENHCGKSYTCALQKEIYKDNPSSYPPAKNKEQQQLILQNFLFTNYPNQIKNEAGKKSIQFRLPNDLYEEKNKLITIIADDPVLGMLYSPDAFILEFNDGYYPLASQILKVERIALNIFEGDTVKIHINKAVLEANTRDVLTNSLHIQMLRDTPVVYGDEKRVKQEHIFTYQIYRNQLKESQIYGGSNFLEYDITGLLNIHAEYFLKDIINNMFVTTENLRNYHYQKQKVNAFYHIQAINLPFQNIEFYWNQL